MLKAALGAPMNRTGTMLARSSVLKRGGLTAARLGLAGTQSPASEQAAPRQLAGASSSISVRVLSSARPLPVDHDGDEGEESEWRPRNQIRGPPRHPAAISPSLNGRGSLPLPGRSRESSSPSAVSAPEGALDATPSDAAKAAEDSPPTTLAYPGGAPMPIVSRLHIVPPEEDVPRGIWPAFRLMDENGVFRPADEGVSVISTASLPNEAPARDDLEGLRDQLCRAHPHHAEEFGKSGLLQPSKFEYADVLSTNTLYRTFRLMIRLSTMDEILLNAQRQGRISFYMSSRGEEAIMFGSSSALDPQDPVFAQYREQGVLMWRGFTLEQFTNQCFSNDRDLGKGRQMPVHYGSRALNYQTVSSPLGTQLPQAVGAAYRLKLAGRPNVAACFFGDGCASTTDFHSALNFAATLEAPVLFFCRNNGYAISTPTSDQYRGDGIVCRAPGYGMAAIRVDGNDVFAVHAAVREARRYALERSAPVLIEAMTYRLGHHSTSDDSTRYRPVDEVTSVAGRFDPILRLRSFLKRHGWVTDQEEASMRDEEKVAVLEAIQGAERRPPPPLDALFEDVYRDMPSHLVEQQSQLREHLAKYPKNYSSGHHSHH